MDTAAICPQDTGLRKTIEEVNDLKKMKRLLSGILAGALVLTANPMALAANDIGKHWAKEYITYMDTLGVMNPSSDGSYKPDQAISRAEFMRYLNRAFHFTEKAQIGFNDVTDTTAWYYEPVQIAVAHGYINGMGKNEMKPLGSLTREQAATIIGRLHKYTPTATAASLTFTDKGKIQSWSAGYIAEAVQNGYLIGYPDGSFKPQDLITRAQMAKMLYAYMGTALDTAEKSYTGKDLRANTDNVTISEPATLSDAQIKGDLYITEGVLGGAVHLQDVAVKGNIIISGGDVTLDGVEASSVISSSAISGMRPITATGETNIGTVEVQTETALVETDLDVSASGFSDLIITGEENPVVSLEGNLWDVKAKEDCTIKTTSSSSINMLTTDAAAKVTGYGSIQRAVIRKNGVSLEMQPVSYELASGVTAKIAGQTVSSANAVSVSPASVTIDLAKMDQIGHSSDYKIDADTAKITKLTYDDKVLKDNKDYRIIDNGFRLYRTFFDTLKEGSQSVLVHLEDGTKGELAIKVINSAKNALDTDSLLFDKYEGASEYANLSVTLSLAAGTTLDDIKLGSTTLERGTDYTFNATTGTVIFQRATLNKKTTGSYTITFLTSKGNNPDLRLDVQDSSPRNEISPSTVDFDANSSSGGNQDVKIKLKAVEKAKLKSILADGQKLTENWQYKIDGEYVVLNKDTISDLAKDGANYCDLIFQMSNGDSPTLRINFVTTYAIRTNLVDTLGNPVQGAKVTVTPNDSEGTAMQTAVTNVEGVAAVYAKRGGYTVTVEGDRFQEKLTRTVNLSGSSQTLRLTAEILENVRIYVTSTNGAKLAGAKVTLGTQSMTTGTDGLAEFDIARGSQTLRVTCSGYKSYTDILQVNSSIQTRAQLSLLK